MKIAFFAAALSIFTFSHILPAQTARNGKIAFVSDRDGDREIYIMNGDGSSQERLTYNPGSDLIPTFSRAGNRIAFVSRLASGGRAIKVMNADGSNQKVITTIDQYETPYPWHEISSLSWSRDDSTIVFDERGSIWTVRLDGSDRRRLGTGSSPSWSPDGSSIIYVNPWTMQTMDQAGGIVSFLPSAGDNWDSVPDWSPGGDRIVFIANSDSWLPEIYTAKADGTDRRVFDPLPCGDQVCSSHRNKPKWSPDGSTLLYHTWEYFGGGVQIYTQSLDRSVFRQLTFLWANYQPSWQPLASDASISGRVTGPGGQGLRNVLVTLIDPNGVKRTTLTSSFGLYSFSGIPMGETVTVVASSRRYRFASRTVTSNGNLTDIDLVGLE